jgi:predicted transport protein
MFSSEKQIQTMVENNLQTLFNLEFIASELQHGTLRMDTLAFDQNRNAFVIIEYKNKSQDGLTDQGFAYKGLFTKHPEFFVLEYNKKMTNQKVNTDEIDWDKSRIIFISPEFTKFQEAIDTKDVPFELWRITLYENNLISLEQLNQISEKILEENKITQKKNTYERGTYTEEQHLSKATQDAKSLYNLLKSKILAINENIRVDPQKKYIAFKSATNIIDVQIQKSNLKGHLNLSLGELNDPKKLTRDVSNIGHYGNGDYEIIISNEKEIPDILALIQQSFEKNK